MPARRARARRRGLALRAREHRGRVLGRRRPGAPGPRLGGRHRDERLHADGRRARRSATPSSSRQRRRGMVTSATKSNASRYGYVLWDEVAEDVAGEFPGVRYERVLVDALAARMVRDPGEPRRRRRVEPLRRHPHRPGGGDPGRHGHGGEREPRARDRSSPGVFEPVHGSAPDIAGQGIANPAGAIWSASLHARPPRRARRRPRALMTALEDVCREGPRTRDVGGDATTARSATRSPTPSASSAPIDDRAPATTSTLASTVRRPIISLRLPMTRAAKTTAQSDCVALSGATTVTRPRSSACDDRRVGQPEGDPRRTRTPAARVPQLRLRGDARRRTSTQTSTNEARPSSVAVVAASGGGCGVVGPPSARRCRELRRARRRRGRARRRARGSPPAVPARGRAPIPPATTSTVPATSSRLERLAEEHEREQRRTSAAPSRSRIAARDGPASRIGLR